MGNLLRTLEAVDPRLFKKEQEAAFYCDRRHKMMHLKPGARMGEELVGRLIAHALACMSVIQPSKRSAG